MVNSPLRQHIFLSTQQSIVIYVYTQNGLYTTVKVTVK